MLKKYLILTMSFCLVGCGLFSSKETPIPAEYAGAGYYLSDADAQRWAFDSKQVEHGFYNNISRQKMRTFIHNMCFSIRLKKLSARNMSKLSKVMKNP